MEMITDLQLDIEEKEVLRRAGYGGGRVVPQGRIREILKEAVRRGYQLAKPVAVCDLFKVKEMDERGLVLENGSRLSVGDRLRFWEGAEYIAAAVCTIGAELEQSTSELFSKGESVLASMLDSVGTVVIDSLEAQVQHLFCQKAHNSGMRIGPKLCPGSRGWPLTEQRVLFSLLPAEKIGVCLTEQCMMMPQKSVSFCSGFGNEQAWQGLDSEKVANPCQLCSMTNCPYRRLES